MMPPELLSPSRPHANQLLKVTTEDRTVVLKVYRPKPHTLKFYKYRALAILGFRIPAEYRTEWERREFERAVYERWSECGYPVPRVYETEQFRPLLPAGAVHLVLEHIPGLTLEDFLRDSSRPPAQKLWVLEKLFQESRHRHERCLQEGDYRLVHFDSNLRNIIVHNRTLFHVDFEMGRSNEPLLRSIAREIQKAAVEAGNILGHEFLKDIAAFISSQYSAMGASRRIIQDTPARGRRRRRSSEGAPPGITRFDLACALERHQGGSGTPQT